VANILNKVRKNKSRVKRNNIFFEKFGIEIPIEKMPFNRE